MMMGCDFFAHAVSQCPRSRRLRGRPREASRTERSVRPKPRRLWGGLSGGLTPICIVPQEGPTLPGGGRPRQHPKGGTQDPHAHAHPTATRALGAGRRPPVSWVMKRAGMPRGRLALRRSAGEGMRAAQKTKLWQLETRTPHTPRTLRARPLPGGWTRALERHTYERVPACACRKKWHRRTETRWNSPTP